MSDSNAYLLGMTKALEDLRQKVDKNHPTLEGGFQQLMINFENLKMSEVETFEEKKIVFETELLELGRYIK